MKRLLLVPIFFLFSQVCVAQQASSDYWLLEMQLQNAIRMSDGYLAQISSSNIRSIQDMYFGYSQSTDSDYSEDQFNTLLTRYVMIEADKQSLPLIPTLIGAFIVQSAFNSYIMQGNPYTNVTLRYRKQFLITPDVNLQLREVGNFVPVGEQ